MNILIKFIFVLILANSLQAYDTKWFGNLRYRTLQDKDTKEGSFSSTSEMRSRLGFIMDLEKISSAFTFQESKVIGQESNFSGTTTKPDSPFLYEVYFKVKSLKNHFNFFQLGRFELALGNQRIISKNNWNNVGRTFEGVLSKEKLFNSMELTSFSLGINESKNYYHNNEKDTWLNGIYLTSKILKNQKESFLDLYLLSFKDSLKMDSYSTFGSRIDMNTNKIHFEGEYAMQSGEAISSNLLSLNLSLILENIVFLKKATFGFESISEDKSTTIKKEGFSKKFGARHKFHGFYDYKDHKSFMDHNHNGLKELYLKMNLKFLFNSSLLIAAHNFKSGNNKQTYGNEIDFIIKKKMHKELSFESGFIFYKPEVKDEFLPFSYFALTANF